jgi:hypothetical protein
MHDWSRNLYQQSKFHRWLCMTNLASRPLEHMKIGVLSPSCLLVFHSERGGVRDGTGIDSEIHGWLDVLVEQKDEVSDRVREEATSLVDLFF